MSARQSKPESLHFDVSSGLKRVLGSELITDDEVAVFELVKNSFDADARQVELLFLEDTIVISDDGIGMTLDDVKSKWLFVAYSSKREHPKRTNFRDSIADRKHYAGSKGVGRFSADRLGGILVLQTRQKAPKGGPVHELRLDWDLFDEDHRTHFEDIKIQHREKSEGFSLPPPLKKLSHGTVITIEKTRRPWDRDAILRLKSALAKLINPFGAATDRFTITIHAPAEVKIDKQKQAEAKAKKTELAQNSLANGPVGNFIFSTLREKTTFIEVKVDRSGTHLESTLTDRGELIYRIREPNPFPLLAKSDFRCEVYFLNASAKATFARRMGVPSVQFGSVFLFRNGFRVFPIGEEGNDWYEMDRRKQQGYARFLGTRDVIGRIDVSGSDAHFSEASSRNQGLIETPAVTQLRRCVADYCLKRLERYVVPVTFVDKEDKNTSDVSRLLTDPGRARVSVAVAKLVDNDDVELLQYSKRLIRILSERSAHFEESLASLRAIAEKTKDRELFRKLEVAEARFEELRRAERAAQEQADEERRAKEAAQARAAAAEKAADVAVEELEEERKRSLFLASISSLDTETILNWHHQVTIYAVDIQQQIENFLVKIADSKNVPTSEVVAAIEGIALLNRKVMGISKFATKANFRLESEYIKADLADYFEQYINGVARDFLLDSIAATVEIEGKGFVQKFKPIDIAVVIDNLIANAKKARATKVHFAITHPSKGSVYVRVSDNGRGFNEKIKDLGRVFEKGFTTTDGSGLGLYHVQHVLGEMNGTIEALSDAKKGAEFLIKISK